MTWHQASEKERAADAYFRAMSTARLDERSGSGHLSSPGPVIAPGAVDADAVEVVAVERVA